MKSFFMAIVAACLLALPSAAAAYCVYNESDSQLNIYVRGEAGIGTLFQILQDFRATIKPGGHACCDGNKDNCDGETVNVYCSRHGQTAAYSGFYLMRHGWAKVRCVRDGEGKPYRMEVIERVSKPGKGQCPMGYTNYGGDPPTCIRIKH